LVDLGMAGHDDLDAWRPRDALRAKAPGNFAQLTDGRTHYSFAGLEHAASGKPLIVCVHGISAESEIWRPFADYFAKRGRTVLMYDLIGRGFTDGSPKDNDLTLFVNQLRELLDHPDVTSVIKTECIDLAGVSLGGAISAGFSSKFPARVAHTVLMAPTGLGLPNFGGVLQTLFKAAWLGRALLNLANLFGLEKNMLKSFGNPTHPLVQERVKAQAARAKELSEHHPGYINSLVSTIAHFPLSNMQAEYTALGASKAKVHVIWGDRDNVVSSQRDAPVLQQLVPQAKLTILEGGGHIDQFVYDPYLSRMHTTVEDFLTQ
jgi:pimeloyl-ACP methyl ester carboxylesterase